MTAVEELVALVEEVVERCRHLERTTCTVAAAEALVAARALAGRVSLLVTEEAQRDGR